MKITRRLVSSGYTTVDVLTNGSLRVAPGGTATNVARAVQSLNWQAAIVGTVGDDPPGRFLSEKLRAVGVDTQRLNNSALWTTPVLVQEAHRGDHRWRFRCPICNTRFATHRPPPSSEVRDVTQAIAAPHVFFFDRASRYTVALAERWSQDGAFIVFEPSTLGVPGIFDEAVAIADLVKFSRQRSDAFNSRLRQYSGSMVETLGSAGVRYRAAGASSWVTIPSNPVVEFVDSAGAGDWTTAGLLSCLVDERGDAQIGRLDEAIVEAQKLGARSCSWEGVFPDAMDAFQVGFEEFACPRVIRKHEA